jgi:tripartite-type tricarboxylate transporter receptor subunit TctC
MAINAHFYKKLGYDAARGFDPIALLARVGFVLVTRSGLPAKNVVEFVALSEASPGKITGCVRVR